MQLKSNISSVEMVQDILDSGKRQLVIAKTLSWGGFLCLFGMQFGLAILLWIAASVLNKKGNQKQRYGSRLKRYQEYIGLSRDLSLKKIAEYVPTTVNEALDDLQSMLDKGAYQGAYIDYGRMYLVIPGREVEKVVVEHVHHYHEVKADPPPEPKAEPKADIKPQAVKCGSCGAPNVVIPGEIKKCPYCRSFL